MMASKGLDAAVDELHPVSPKLLYVGLHGDVAVAHALKQVARDGGMCRQDFMVGGGKPIALDLSNQRPH